MSALRFYLPQLSVLSALRFEILQRPALSPQRYHLCAQRLEIPEGSALLYTAAFFAQRSALSAMCYVKEAL